MFDLLPNIGVLFYLVNIKRILLLALFFFSICLLVPQTSKAVDLKQVLTSENSIFIKIQEGVEYFFAFRVENKVQVLERQAERRLSVAKGYADQGNEERVQSVMQSYLQIKEKQNDLLGKAKTKDALGDVEERTIEQQKTMEEIKTKIDDNGKQGVVEVQEKVVNQVAQRIIEVNGTEGQTEFFNKVEHVWAPGTSGTGSGGVTVEGGGTQWAPGTSAGGSSGVVVVGGTIQFAPGTSAGGSGGSEVKTGGDSGANVVEGGGGGGVSTPGGQGETGATNTIDPGGLEPGTTSDGKNEVAP